MCATLTVQTVAAFLRREGAVPGVLAHIGARAVVLDDRVEVQRHARPALQCNEFNQVIEMQQLVCWYMEVKRGRGERGKGLTTKEMVPEILNLPPSVQMQVIRIATNTDIAVEYDIDMGRWLNLFDSG